MVDDKHFKRKLERTNASHEVDYRIALSDLTKRASVVSIVPLIDRDVTASETIRWRCSEGHEFEASWRQQQRRRCPKCIPDVSYGEKLARALLNLYFPDGEWGKVREKGLDPDNPELRLEIDLVSEPYQITVECQSSLHDREEPKQGFATKISIEEMSRRDELKRNLGSSHPRFASYRHVEFWFELSEVRKLVTKAAKSGVDPIAAIVERFERSLAKGGVELPKRRLPDANELFAAFSEAQRAKAELQNHGLQLEPGPWLGVTTLTVACDECGHKWTSSLSQLRRGWSRGRTGCGRCWSVALDELSADRSKAGWDSFRDLCEDHAVELVQPTSGLGNVSVSVREIATGRLFEGKRPYIAERLSDGLPIFDAKQIEYAKRRDRVQATMQQYRSTLSTFGIELVDGGERPTTERGPDGKIRTNLFTVRFLACKDERQVNIGTFIKRLIKHKTRRPDGTPSFCPDCLDAELARENTKWLAALAVEHGVTFLGPDYIDARETKYKFSCYEGCTQGIYEASFTNLRGKGIACRGCKALLRYSKAG